jgi:hypothetical protein
VSGQHAAKEDAAALGFMAFLALCLGGAGILIAALAVGVERAWSGRDGASGGGGRQSLADHRAWLDLDRDRRSAWRQARRDWWRDGADPDTRPAGPGWWRRFRDWWHRAWARTALAADRFAEGWRAGYEAARQARRNGASAWETARTRPVNEDTDHDPTAPGRQDVPNDAPTKKEPTLTQTTTTPPPAGTPFVVGQGDGAAARYEQDSSGAWWRVSLGTGDRTPVQYTYQPPNATTHVATNGGPPMTTPTTPASTSTAPAGETNLDLTDADLAAIHAHLARIGELNDQMAGARAALEGAVAVATERATTNGATAATQQALDEANAVVALLGQHVGGVADAAAAASDHTSAAQAGLAPARDAQDTLHSAGARGEFVSTATSD